MNKFTLMIISVSIFFIGIGGIAKQISANLDNGDREMVMLPRIQSAGGDDVKKSFTFIRKVDKHIRIEGEKIEMLDIQPKISLRFPHQHGEKIEFLREQSSEPLKLSEEFPRIGDKNIIIFQEKPDEKLKTPQIKIFIDKENK